MPNPTTPIPATPPDPTAQPPHDPPANPPAPDADDAAQLREQLAAAQAQLAATRRRNALETTLREAGAVDVEAAAILIEALRDASASGEPDHAAAVRDLKTRRPNLFRAPPAPSAGSAMSPALTTTPHTAIHRAAEEARQGDPNAVLRYMRLRREAH
jgi:hypothetical protein